MHEYLGKKIKVTIDRPLGSAHPRYPDMIYPINYGFIPETIAGDGMEVDVFILGVDKPLQEFEGVCIAIIHRKDDNENKLVAVPEGVTMTKDEIEKAVHFQEKYFDSEIVME